MALTTEQALILNNLMYMESSGPMVDVMNDSRSGSTVREWLENIDINQIPNDSRYHSGTMTGEDWKNIIEAARNDETLMNMTIVSTHTDSAGGGKSAIFVNSDTGDAVVAFKGTSGGEWKDNFTGGNVTDTPLQENALEWYQSAYKEHGLEGYEVTVTGHSKGGNKAKYITLLDDTVDHCVSFDGQGFSDEFMEKYADQIAARQGNIENHNVDYDFVNLLLNDVGETTYYEGQDVGSFFENHCANTFMKFDGDGNFSMVVNPNGQGQEMKALDEFLNNLIRSMPESGQSETLEFFGLVADCLLGGKDLSAEEQMQFIWDLAFDSKYSDDLAYTMAYLIEYAQANPELAEQINSVLDKFGLGEFTEYVDMVNGILNFDEDYFLIGHVDFDRLYGWVTGAIGFLPDGVLQWLLDWVEDKYGIKLTVDQLKKLLEFAGMVYDDMQHIKIEDNGADITVDSVSSDFDAHSGVATHGRIYVDIQKLHASVEELLLVVNLLGVVRADVEDLSSALSSSQRLAAMSELQEKLQQCKLSIDLLMGRAKNMGGALDDIARKYESTEALIVSSL